MSRKTKKSHTTKLAPVDRSLRVVTDTDGLASGKPNSDDRVFAALRNNPGATTAAVAIAAGVGRSTAAKILARWDAEGTVTRTPGADHRSPDTWTVPSLDADCTDDDPATINVSEAAASPSVGPETPHDAARTDTERDTGSTSSETLTESSAAQDQPDGVPGSTTYAAADTGADGPPTASSADVTPPATGPMAKERLAKGALRGMVEDYLAEHPDDSFGPTKIGKDLNKSGGAVNNALEKLVAEGYAIKTCEAPKRFQYKRQTADAQ
ncbi:hypothetical protein [Amycolatopsis aidingensis]|uniref:hypothetical protein n=1 Tax=Amycolatopsis aidingensis TaxID=2842453 RepID=UPI001C0C5CE5|nr:hypothetical protein [Amycolatopsis aidingensis]